MTTLIPAAYLRGALAAAATKDVRYYLNGVFFDTVAKRIAATDGHMIYAAKNIDTSAVFSEPTILEPFSVPASADHVIIEHLKDNKYEIACQNAKGPVGKSQLVKSIDGRYPDYTAALSGLDVAVKGEPVPTMTTIAERTKYAFDTSTRVIDAPEVQDMPLSKDAGLDLRLLARASKILPLARIDFTGRERITYLTQVNNPDEIIGIMPLNKMGAPETLQGWCRELKQA